MRIKEIIVAVGMVVFCNWPFMASKEIEWQEAKLVSVTLQVTSLVGVDIFLYTIETSDKFYTFRFKENSVGLEPLNLWVNGPVKFYVEDNAIVILDPNGKLQHRTSIILKGIREAKKCS